MEKQHSTTTTTTTTITTPLHYYYYYPTATTTTTTTATYLLNAAKVLECFRDDILRWTNTTLLAVALQFPISPLPPFVPLQELPLVILCHVYRKCFSVSVCQKGIL